MAPTAPVRAGTPVLAWEARMERRSWRHWAASRHPRSRRLASADCSAITASWQANQSLVAHEPDHGQSVSAGSYQRFSRWQLPGWSESGSSMPAPTDDYTPHGYLNIPTHTRHLTPRGVLRSWGLGWRWHMPAYAGSYGGARETYRAGVRIGVAGALELAELEQVSSPYHSCNIVMFSLTHQGQRTTIRCYPIGDQVLRMTIQQESPGQLTLWAQYRRLLGASGAWGESGLVGRINQGQ